MTIKDDFGRMYDINVKNIAYIEKKTHIGNMGTYFNININFTRNQQIIVSYEELDRRDDAYMLLREAIQNE